MLPSDKDQALSHEELLSYLKYDPLTGVFVWRRSRSGHAAGRVAGYIKGDGYVAIKLFGRLYSASRLAWFYMTGAWPTTIIDHWNTIKSDNRWSNLREATHSQNAANTKKLARNTSGWKNVTWNAREQKWIARVQRQGARKNIGYFDCPAAAFLATLVAADEMHGEFYRYD